MNILRLILALIVGTLLGILIAWWATHSMQPKNNHLDRSAMTMFIGSRLSDSSLKTFLDDRHIHGIKYFKFELDLEDKERLIKWLDLTEIPNLPERYLSSMDYLKKSSGWENFDWSTARIYSSVYCNVDGSENMFDLLLVDGKQVIYATLGYIHPKDLKHNAVACVEDKH